MRILMIHTLYTHMQRTVDEGRWVPEGMPAFYKLVEKLRDKGSNVDMFLFSRYKSGDVREGKQFKISDQVSIQAIPLPTMARNRAAKAVTELVYLFHVLLFLWSQKRKGMVYDTVYCDRGNVFIGAVLSLLRYRVMLRLYGVGALRAYLSSMRNIPLRLCFAAPFTEAVATLDGSPVWDFARSYLNKKTERHLLFNGIDTGDREPVVEEPTNGRVKILFLGRLEKFKGIMEFIDAICVLKDVKNKFFVTVVGDGDLKRDAMDRVKESGLEEVFSFVGRVPHGQALTYMDETDIFVSLYHYGDLSNATLEAIAAKKCIVTMSDKTVDYDDDKGTVFNNIKNAFIRVGKAECTSRLPKILWDLILKPEYLSQHKQMTEKASKGLRSWDERIQIEMDLIRKAEKI